MISNLEDRPLYGKTLFLLANISTKDYCEEYPSTDMSNLDVEEAIISLARAVFSEGGHLVLKNNTLVSLLVSFVASEYLSPRVAEGRGNFREERQPPRPMVAIYQQKSSEESSQEIQLFAQLDYITLNEITSEQNITGRIIEETNPIALVCIGSSEDTIRDLISFHRFRDQAPIYTIATRSSAEDIFKHINEEIPVIHPIDTELIDELTKKWKNLWQRKHEVSEVRESFELKYKPYGLIMQKLVEDIIHSDLNGERRL
jgi:hypothetical protein